MARKKKKSKGGGGATWLITFSDMMTLMLTFFVLLVSMSTVDERRRLVVLGSIIGTFGFNDAGFDLRSLEDTKKTVEPGPMDETEDLAPLKDLIFEDLQNDLNFQSNRYVQIVSISDEVLFKPGTPELLPKGKQVIDRILPVLLKVKYPLLLAGHTSTIRHELEETAITFKEKAHDPTWELSLLRILTIYNYLVSRGMDPEYLRMESFGRFRPKFSNDTPANRKGNSRVDIVLDRRNSTWITLLDKHQRRGSINKSIYSYDGFDFKIAPKEEDD